MANFLNRLAARALGTIPLVEPAIPTRFSSGTQSNAFLAYEPAVQSTHPYPDTSLETSEVRPHPLHDRETDPNLETRGAPPASPFQEAAPHLLRSPLPHAFPRQVPPPPFAESGTVPPSPKRDEVGDRHLAAEVNPTSDAAERPATYEPQVTSPARVPVVKAQPLSRLTPLAEPMGSPVFQHSERLQPFHPIPPTVSVSIGRIEVRAEITSPSPTASVQRPRPSALSLDQFLKQVDGSAR